MKVVASDDLDEFMELHADSRKGIERWLNRVKAASWRNPNEMARQMSNFDRLGGGVYVFDIHNNRYRLIAYIDYANQSVDVRFIGTHADYDRL